MTILVLTHERIIELSAHQGGGRGKCRCPDLALFKCTTDNHQVTDKCFKKCITSPGSSMGSSDQKCVAMCMDRLVLFVHNWLDCVDLLISHHYYLCSFRYMDSFNLVSKAYTRRLQQEM